MWSRTRVRARLLGVVCVLLVDRVSPVHWPNWIFQLWKLLYREKVLTSSKSSYFSMVHLRRYELSYVCVWAVRKILIGCFELRIRWPYRGLIKLWFWCQSYSLLSLVYINIFIWYLIICIKIDVEKRNIAALYQYC